MYFLALRSITPVPVVSRIPDRATARGANIHAPECQRSAKGRDGHMDSAKLVAVFMLVTGIAFSVLLGCGCVYAGWHGLLKGEAPIKLSKDKPFTGKGAIVFNVVCIVFGVLVALLAVVGVVLIGFK